MNHDVSQYEALQNLKAKFAQLEKVKDQKASVELPKLIVPNASNEQ